MIVYHRTTPEAAQQIMRTRVLLSREQGEVCVSDHLDGYAAGYGTAAVELDIPEHLLTVDDEFQTGESHYRTHVTNIRPENIKRVYTAEHPIT